MTHQLARQVGGVPQTRRLQRAQACISVQHTRLVACQVVKQDLKIGQGHG
jgi:hypothetical protein